MTQAANFQHPSNNVAANLFRTWLRASGIPHKSQPTPDLDFEVTATDGSTIGVCIDREHVPAGAISVARKAMTGKRVADALAAFWSVTEAAGYGRPNPIERGAEPATNERGNPRKLHYRQEPFLVSIRHTEFRRSPDPTPEQWAQYEPVLKRAAGTFYRNYRNVLLRNGYDYEDVLTQARCLLVNFCARHEVEGDPRNGYRAKVYILQHLFSDGAKVMLKKERSVLPDAETASIGVYGRPDYEDGDAIESAEEEEEERAASKARLQSRFDALSHEDLVDALRRVILKRNGQASRLAAKRLVEHRAQCTDCDNKRQSVDVPQANSLPRARALLARIALGCTRPFTVPQTDIVSSRQVTYYRHALRTLGLIAGKDDAVTIRGHQLLDTEPGSALERMAWRAAIGAALPDLDWFFASSESVAAAADFLRRRYWMQEKTARRRAAALAAWRRSLAGGDARVQEDEEAAGLDAVGV